MGDVVGYQGIYRLAGPSHAMALSFAWDIPGRALQHQRFSLGMAILQSRPGRQKRRLLCWSSLPS